MSYLQGNKRTLLENLVSTYAILAKIDKPGDTKFTCLEYLMPFFFSKIAELQASITKTIANLEHPKC